MSSLAQELGLSESEARQVIGDYLNYHVIVIFTYGLYTMLFAATLKRIGTSNSSDLAPLVSLWLSSSFAPRMASSAHYPGHPRQSDLVGSDGVHRTVLARAIHHVRYPWSIGGLRSGILV